MGMLLDKEQYSICRGQIANWLATKPCLDMAKEISAITLYTGAPAIVVVEYVMEIVGRTDELAALQQRLMDFYRVDGWK